MCTYRNINDPESLKFLFPTTLQNLLALFESLFKYSVPGVNTHAQEFWQWLSFYSFGLGSSVTNSSLWKYPEPEDCQLIVLKLPAQARSGRRIRMMLASSELTSTSRKQTYAVVKLPIGVGIRQLAEILQSCAFSENRVKSSVGRSWLVGLGCHTVD